MPNDTVICFHLGDRLEELYVFLYEYLRSFYDDPNEALIIEARDLLVASVIAELSDSLFPGRLIVIKNGMIVGPGELGPALMGHMKSCNADLYTYLVETFKPHVYGYLSTLENRLHYLRVTSTEQQVFCFFTKSYNYGV